MPMKKTVELTPDSRCNELTLTEVCEFLRNHDDYLILCHATPDGDTLGSAFALARGLKNAGKRCMIKCADEIPAKYSYFTSLFDNSEIDYKTVVAVDVADIVLLGSIAGDFVGKIDLCIDHHISNTRFADNLYLDSQAAANCECIYDIFHCMPMPFDNICASAIYTGLSTDTGSFKYSNVTAKTHRIAADLYAFDFSPSEVSRLMFDTKSRGRLELERMVLDSAQFYFDDKCMVLVATNEMKEKTGCNDNDLEGVAVISRSVEGVLAGVSIKEKENGNYKISLRTYPPLNASEICKVLGGGGHKNAAGCSLSGNIEDVKKQVLAVIGKALEESNAGSSSHK
ncbi:MAG: bifunctional oligoribonuclease/PAP phosphatase NrnA [Acutalibacteraceae bacterium]|nr:bifunctional oligoribonuclease/PAP phosphatase NrnA [Acutalibacteraceae bacterium]